MKKSGKEITLEIDSSYKIVLGTVNNKDPKSIYISLCAWGEPMKETEYINYDSVISNLRKQIKHNLHSTIDVNDFHLDKYIVDLNMRSSGICEGKRSFMSCEITLFQKNNIPVTKPKMINSATNIIKNVIGSCLDRQDHFSFYKTKK
jgi:hypothetical protein|tara:strand:+ start:717 stop:1157 length:441 start_codon:yes stop_codon:yes gene_type:complete